MLLWFSIENVIKLTMSITTISITTKTRKAIANIFWDLSVYRKLSLRTLCTSFTNYHEKMQWNKCYSHFMDEDFEGQDIK